MKAGGPPCRPGETLAGQGWYHSLAILRSGRREQVIECREASSPRWSPDGALILFGQYDPGASNPNRTWVIRPNGSGKRELPVGEFAVWWSPQGRLVWNQWDAEAKGVFAYDLASGERQMLFDGAPGLLVADSSPDGRMLAVLDADNDVLKLVRPDGSLVKVVSRRRVTDAEWSPDGRELALVIAAAPGNVDIWVVRRNGSGLRRLTRTRDAIFPSWAPGRLSRRGWR